jgi:pyruvate/2-oxoacid:ferredoxin oxidoreductase beta subunit
MFWSKAEREHRRDLKASHGAAMKRAQAMYDAHKHESVVITEGPGFVSAADPYREAWDVYFDSMLEQGYFPKQGMDKFDRDLKR